MIKVSADPGCGEGLFSGSQMSLYLPAVSSHGQRGDRSLWGSFLEGL